VLFPATCRVSSTESAVAADLAPSTRLLRPPPIALSMVRRFVVAPSPVPAVVRAPAPKFSLNGDQGLDIFDPGYPASQRITCDTSAEQDPVEETVTAGSSGLSYDPTTDQYTYVWKTNKAWATTCRQLIVKLNDHTSHMAYFTFKR
jgi:hypothetical protein